ncbi:hypothetical protein FLONG3_880 [Fusarium longipes]|uniref:Uncharacterized protein n=1 Tax=Fusarium longipes TaxID=694270 RepID=A0A395T871_9HYPO|nr:hypothetical protein FLONG3_880 [Fusarium longipes]
MKRHVWHIDQATSEKTLKTKTFRKVMKDKWMEMAKNGVTEAEIQAYKDLLQTITTRNIQEINDLPVPSSWFPKTNLQAWKFNESGPTSDPSWKNNPFQHLHGTLLERMVKDMPVRHTPELLKRPRSSETIGENEEGDNSPKRLRLDSPSSVESGDTTLGDTIEDVEETIPDPATFDQTTPVLPVSVGETDDSEDTNEFWSDFDDKLAPIRKAAKEGTEITPRMLNILRKAHLKELKKQHPDKLLRQIKKRHARDLQHV